MRAQSCSIALALGVAFVGGLGPQAAAAEVSWRAASCFPANTYFSKRFEAFVAEANEIAKGKIRIQYVGGAPAIGSPYELVKRAAAGVFQIVSCTGSYYQNVLPEADTLKMIEKPIPELRKNGGIAYLNKLHQEKNLYYLARTVAYTPFHLYLNKKIDKADLKGLRIRVAPIYVQFFEALGATTIQSTLAEIYTYMENGTVDGYGWPVTGLLPDWHKVTKYRVDPGFYDADIQILINFTAWKKLDDEQRALLKKLGQKYEAMAEDERKVVAQAKALQTKNGIEAIVLSDDEAKKWLSVARETSWAKIVQNSPTHGPELRKLLAKE